VNSLEDYDSSIADVIAKCLFNILWLIS
jgi:hypothetical protein